MDPVRISNYSHFLKMWKEARKTPRKINANFGYALNINPWCLKYATSFFSKSPLASVTNILFLSIWLDISFSSD